MNPKRKLLAAMISAGLIWNTSALALNIPPDILNEIQQHGAARVIVELDVPWQPEGLLRGAEAVVAQRQQLADTQQQFVTQLSQDLVNSGLFDDVNSGDGTPLVKPEATYETIPYLVLEVSEATLPLVQQQSLTKGLTFDHADEPSLAQSLPLIGADKAGAAGYTGKGQSVAVLDTGVDSTHSYFSTNRILQQACFSATSCPDGQKQQIGAGAAVPCSYDAPACLHGTHVAGIAASVAKEASIIAVQVFSKQLGMAKSLVSDQLAALDWLHQTYGNPDSKLAAVNLSLGGGKFASACDDDSRKKAIDNLRSVGIATIISSGNNGYSDGIAAPACISSAISVGATDKSDNVATFSNSANILNLLAPGVDIVSSLPGSKTGAMSGTSMAAPHVAGAWAVLKAAKPTATVAELLTTLQSTGKMVTGKGVTKARVQLDKALSPPVMATGCDVVKDGLVACYPFDGDAKDYSGNGHDGVIQGGLNYPDGVSNKAASFNGATKVLFPSIGSNYFSGDFSINFSLKLSSLSQFSVLAKRNSCDIGNFFDLRGGSSGIYFETYTLTPRATSYAMGQIVPNQWNLVTLMKKGTNSIVYINGLMTDQKTAGSILANTAVFGISNSPCIGIDGTGMLKGELDDLRIYNRALSETEIKQLYGKETLTVTKTGSGFTDVAKAFNDSSLASIDVHLSNGTSNFTIQRWATKQGSFWDAQQWFAGDFNGDGFTDVAKAFNDSGSASIDVHLSNGTGSFTIQRWATKQGGFWDTQQWFTGDFNGDGFTDVAKAFKDGGLASIDVHLSNGTNGFTIQRWATKQGSFWDAQQWFAGDFNGDGFTDVAKAFKDGGLASIDVHLSNGTNGFTIQRWATKQGSFWDAQQWFAGDFNGDGFTDVAKAFKDGGLASIDVHLSNGTNGFTIQRWATKQGSFWDAQQWFAGDFNGDGFTDVAKAFNESGLASIDVHLSNGTNGFTIQRWATKQGNFWNEQQWFAGDFNGIDSETKKMTLTVTKTGDGQVTGNGITCGTDCTEDLAPNTQVTLTATATTGSMFKQWTGDCTGTTATVTVTMDKAKSCSATFNQEIKYTLTVTTTGNGTVTGPGDYPKDTPVTLTATPATGYTFKDWTGDCAGTTTPLTVTMDKAKTCIATFEPIPTGLPLTVNKADTDRGRISGRLRGETATSLTCDNACQTANYNYPKDGVVILTATADKGFEFKTWTCTGSSYTQDPATSNILKVTMTTATTCTANFDAIPGQLFTLTVNLIGTGMGTVVSNKMGFDCQGTQCTGVYVKGQKLTLTATPNLFSSFLNWGGDCTGTNLKAPVTLTKDLTCTAQFQSILETAAAELVKVLYTDGFLENKADVASQFSQATNQDRLKEAFWLAVTAILQADSNLAATQQWPAQLNSIPWYSKSPIGQYTESIQLQAGEYVDIQLKLLDNAGVEQEVVIVIYYSDTPPTPVGDSGSGRYSIPIYVPKSFASQWGW